MGFDLHGLNPAMRVAEEDKYPRVNKYADMGTDEKWEAIDKLSKEDKDKYYDEYFLRQDENPGVYFRANVWWWRTHWEYVCFNCKDILTEEEHNLGHSNGGHKVTEEQATAIAKKMFEHIDSGEARGYERHHNKVMEKAKENNRKLKEDGKQFGEDWDWRGDYPFEVRFLREFAVFCSESGGFRIC